MNLTLEKCLYRALWFRSAGQDPIVANPQCEVDPIKVLQDINHSSSADSQQVIALRERKLAVADDVISYLVFNLFQGFMMNQTAIRKKHQLMFCYEGLDQNIRLALSHTVTEFSHLRAVHHLTSGLSTELFNTLDQLPLFDT
mgnify:CR=1 FL=1